jgi:hypothetical protein
MISELQAVNQMLAAQGLSPINSLEGKLSKDATTAKNMLDQVRRQVGMEIWSWNVDPNYTLSKNELGEVPYPSNLVRFSVPHAGYVQMVNGRLYDRANKTYIFKSAVTGEAHFVLEWSDQPPEAQNYVATRAARVAYEQFLGTDETRQQLFIEEQTALRQMEQRDAEVARYNMLDESTLPHFHGSSILPGYSRKHQF